MGQSFDEFTGEGGGVDVKPLTDFFANEAVVLGVVSYFGSDDDALGGGEVCQGVAEFVGATGTWLLWSWFSRRSVVVGLGGVGLF